MRKIIVLTIVLLACQNALTEPFYPTHITRKSKLFDGTEYVFTSGRIDESDIPRWTDKSKCPPLAPWAAAEKAMAFMKDIPPREDLVWRVASISLSNALGGGAERWLYEIRIVEGETPGHWIDGPAQSLMVIVLMNGEIPEPTIKKKNRIPNQQSEPTLKTPDNTVDA